MAHRKNLTAAEIIDQYTTTPGTLVIPSHSVQAVEETRLRDAGYRFFDIDRSVSDRPQTWIVDTFKAEMLAEIAAMTEGAS